MERAVLVLSWQISTSSELREVPRWLYYPHRCYYSFSAELGCADKKKKQHSPRRSTQDAGQHGGASCI